MNTGCNPAMMGWRPIKLRARFGCTVQGVEYGRAGRSIDPSRASGPTKRYPRKLSFPYIFLQSILILMTFIF
jgi:hypothetical protein